MYFFIVYFYQQNSILSTLINYRKWKFITLILLLKIMQVNKLLKPSRKHKSATGFTLVELLISAFIGVLVIGAAGYGLINLLRNNRSSTAQIQKRTEFNRAVDFISDEMRRADTIEVDPTTAFAAVPSPPANAQPVLAINIPGVTNPAVSGVDSPIVYFVSEPSSGDASVWNGPRVIYRYGPPSDANGNFTGGTWGIEPLVDGISADTVTTNCDTNPDWSASPSSGATGFYACILPTTDDNTVGETAKLFAIGKLDDANSNSDNYQASTQVFARAEEENLEGDNPDESFNAVCSFSGGALVCPSSNPNNPLTYDVERLSDSFACKPDGTKWKVTVTAYYIDPNDGSEQYFDLIDSNGNTTGSNSENVNLETTNLAFSTDQSPLFRVTPDTANSPSCDTVNDPDVFTSNIQNHSPISSNNSNQFLLLGDADIISDNLKNPAYLVSDTSDSDKAQKDAIAILEENNLIDPVENNKVNTGQDFLVAFEIGQTKPDPDDPLDFRRPGYDFQDQMFKINVK